MPKQEEDDEFNLQCYVDMKMIRPKGIGSGLPPKAYIGYPVLLIIAALIPVVSIFFVGNMNELFDKNEMAHQWFQRSGSLTTLIPLIVEFQIMKRLTLSMEGFSNKDTIGGSLSLEEIEYLNNLQVLILSLVVTGTVIWGYGDILYLSAT